MGETVAGILAAAGIIGALFVIGRALAWFFGLLRRLARLVDALTGEPPGPGEPKGRPGVLDRLEAIETRVAALEAQLYPNGGHSLRDTVDRVAAVVEATPPPALPSPPPDGGVSSTSPERVNPGDRPM